MKKSRNSFFAESNYQSFNPYNNPNNGPYQASSNYFYQGPVPNNYNTNNAFNDTESRFAKIERQLNRLEYRVSKLENNTSTYTTDEIDFNSTNMYML